MDGEVKCREHCQEIQQIMRISVIVLKRIPFPRHCYRPKKFFFDELSSFFTTFSFQFNDEMGLRKRFFNGLLKTQPERVKVF